MDKNMETTIVYWGYICIGDNGKENGEYLSILGSYLT